MNLEELEQSLRAEFKGYLSTDRAGWRDELARLREMFDALAARLEEDPQFDAAFTETVGEHLRLARDKGAEITATAMDEAEKLNGNSAAIPVVQRTNDLEWLREAVTVIRSQNTQAAILTALVDSASRFAARGAFFILKSEQFIGWKAFGCADSVTDETVRSIHFSANYNTLLADCLVSLKAEHVEGSPREDDHEFLAPLGFGKPDKMWAFPLVARGRGVAVLYADPNDADSVNVDALEMLVSVAGMSVELLANAASASKEALKQESVEESRSDDTELGPTDVPGDVNEPAFESEQAGDASPSQPEGVYEVDAKADEAAIERPADPVDHAANNGFAFSPSNFDAQPLEAEVEAAEPEPVTPEPEAEPKRRSYRERALDLPIEVSDEERPAHSDARRFARLLISEIKLYNQAKVNEAREACDIYDMLREAIDRSREMYEARVKPDVAAKFDYFHYELVNNLAEGDEEKLGAGYLALKA